MKGHRILGQWTDEAEQLAKQGESALPRTFAPDLTSREAAVVSAELVACTLGARRRPDLEVDHAPLRRV